MGNDGAKLLAEIIKYFTTITQVLLIENKIGDDGIEALAEAIKKNNDSKLTELDLTGNVIGTKGAKALAELLSTNTSINKLGLRNNPIENEGIKALADAMEINTTICELNVSSKSYLEKSRLNKEVIKQQCGLNATKTMIEANIAAALDLLTLRPNLIDGSFTSVRDVNNLIAQKLFVLDKSEKLISAKIRKNPDIVINKYT